ncbi:hypothetical protein AAG906_010552 [Vitis piasezkii]
MHSEFEMSIMGELKFFIGLQIKQLKERTFINQAKYIIDLLKRFNMEEAKTMKTPMISSIKFYKDEKGKSIYSTMYRGMIGSLLYLTASRPDIMLRFRIWTVFSSSCKPQSALAPFSLHFRMPRGKRPVEPSQPKARRKHFILKGLFTRMGWLPMVIVSELIFPTLVRAFYSRMTYGMGGPIISTVRRVEIRLDPENICCIFDIAPVGLKVYESKMWPTVPRFELREAIQRILLHHMLCSIFLPREGHRDKVSYYEAFLIDSILTGRRIHLGYLMMMYMISRYESTTRVLSYGRFLTKVFKDVGVDLSPIWFLGKESRESTCTSLGTRTKPELDIHPLQSKGVPFEATFSELMMSELTCTMGPSTQQHMEELAIVSDTQFYSMEDHMDQHQAGFTSQFGYLQ